ncbi:MAG: tRNA (N(6)-L-threonylcarbamoyladenosine(37)-C(2))-methylthiotransferase MtaB [Victivallaceae bacterium]|nr:tRNA (N(6)-L-threonylcarbamoyladenosine(37)-C(2))-methylthiotransferase MtaB [Victivallaceae bacterium]
MNQVIGNAAVFTLGCRLNQADTALICARLKSDGWRIVRPEYPGRLDLLIINTCTVTAAASRKSRQATRRFRSKHPEACILVTGCSAETENSQWKNESAADIILTNPEKKQISSLVGDFLREKTVSGGSEFSVGQTAEIFREQIAGSFPFRSRAFLKIQEGCNNFCTYCIVPYARGPERSRNWDEVITEFKQLLAAGFEEIVLTGVNICAYNDHGRNLNELLSVLSRIPGRFRIRLSSTEPHPNHPELVETMAGNPKICRFLHLSLQHGCDEILRAMGRKYTAAEFAFWVGKARELIPGIHLGTDVIVGFPGETEAHFEQALEFIGKMKFANLHIFTYSPRQGTPAAALPGRVPGAVAEERRRRLTELAAAMQTAFTAPQAGEILPVIFERKNRAGCFQGWSDNYVNVLCADAGVEKQVITPVKISAVVDGNSLLGTINFTV